MVSAQGNMVSIGLEGYALRHTGSKFSSTVRLTMAAIAMASALGFSHANGQDAQGYHRYYFKQKLSLALDASRIAVLQEAGAQNFPDAGLALHGVMPEDIAPHPIRNWSFATVANQQRQVPADIEQLVDALAQEPGSVYYSPVFFDDLGGPLIVTPYILVGFNQDLRPEQAEAILFASGAGEIVDADWGNMPNVFRLRSRAKNGFRVLDDANSLALLDEVRFAEPDMIFSGRSSIIPNDPGFPNCWGIHNTGQFGGTVDMDMDGPEAWDVTTGDSSIIVVVLDTGVQQNHPDINQVAGNDFTTDAGNGGPVNACDNHGTPVAGCISAIINNNRGTVGIAPDCNSASARIGISNQPCNGTWNGQNSWTVEALTWAESIGARVTNNSNSYGTPSAAIDSKYDSTRTNGMVHFASAGNNAVSSIAYPSSIPSVNSVAALDDDGNLATFPVGGSNWGTGLAFSAPGHSIYTTDRTGADGYVSGDYVFINGTSFASPYTAGVAALVLSMNPTLDAVDVESILQTSSVDLGAAGYDTTFGWGFVNASSAVQATCGSSIRVERFKLLASDGAANDQFGISVSITGSPGNEVAIVGAYEHNDNGSRSGSAYIYRYNGVVWVEEAKLLASDGAAGDWFGRSVSISGDPGNEVAIVGAYEDNDNGTHSGSAYIYRYNGVGWVEETKLLASDGAADDRFGFSVSIIGSAGNEIAIVGAFFDNDNGPFSGSAYIYRYNGVAWVQEPKLIASDGAAGDVFGITVSITGSPGNEVAIVGAPYHFENGEDSGSAYIYRYNGVVWVEEVKLIASDGATNDLFGYSVSISGSPGNEVAIVGAIRDVDNGLTSGSAYIYRYNGVAWGEEAKLFASDGATDDRFGISVSIIGSAGNEVAIVGAWQHDDNGSDSGSAYIYRYNGVAWVEETKLLASDGAADDRFGFSVSISGDPGNEVAIVGAFEDNDNGTNSGSAYLFSMNCEGTGSGFPCPADTDGSGDVNVTDLLDLLAAWGPNPGHVADINDDGNVNVTDLLALLAAWGACP